MPEQENTVGQKTHWFETIQIESPIMVGAKMEKSKLVVLHQCGENKEELINQLKSLIEGIETDFKYFKG